MSIPSSVILAAGKGTRMKTDLPKVAVSLKNKPLIIYVLDSIQTSGIHKKVVVVGFKKEIVIPICKEIPGVEFAEQMEQLGTGHALLSAESNFLNTSDHPILVACGDVPLIHNSTFESLLKLHTETKSQATILTAHMENPSGYGRIIRNSQGLVEKIVEEKDANDKEKSVQEINTGTYVFQSGKLFEYLKSIKNTNAQKEYYLTDLIEVYIRNNDKVSALQIENPSECQGINSPQDLESAENILNELVGSNA
jgi:UDP-N-acetylglucosamine pyrophosphorylase